MDLSTQPTTESILTSWPILAVKKIDTAKVASRLIFLLLCQGILIILDSESLITGKYRFIPYLIEYIFLGGQGFLNALVFLSDRSLIQSFKILIAQKLQSSNKA
ncbi:hypothetical protein BKA69DRAFT_1127776 [Paraphysoderma sedebokerense]|nr:hypothetical protein BKA69DRAFT_1127776 [Paraphysoderma sedebokerense]